MYLALETGVLVLAATLSDPCAAKSHRSHIYLSTPSPAPCAPHVQTTRLFPPRFSAMNYVVTAHPASKVTHTAVGNFLGDGHRNLVIAKVTRLEVFSISAEGLVRQLLLPIYGRIVAMALYRAPGAAQDDLAVLVEKNRLAILRWDADAAVCTTVLTCDVHDHLASSIERQPIMVVDPFARCIAIHLSQHMLKIVPTNASSDAQAFNVRMPDSQIEDIVFLEGCKKPTVAVLSQDTDEAHHIKTYEISLSDQDMAQGSWERDNVDAAAQNLIAMPAAYGGVVVVAEQALMYVNGDKPTVTTATDPAMITSVAKVDADGSRFLLGDHLGVLRMLVLDLEPKSGSVQAMEVQMLGETSISTAISYLDKGYVYVGSDFGDAQLVRLSTEKNPATGHYTEVVQTYPNLGPITDFCMVKNAGHTRHGQGHVVTCSGGAKDGSLRVIRNGIGISEQACVELPGIKDMWSVRRHYGDRYHAYLVQSFASETRILELVVADEMAPASLMNIDEEATTLYMGNLIGDLIVQVTSTGVNLLDCSTYAEAAAPAWTPPEGVNVLVAAGSATQLLLATTGGNLTYLEVDPASKTLVERAHVKLDNEIACLTCTPLGPLAEDGTSTNTTATVAAVGLWAGSGIKEVPTVRLIALPSLATACTISLEDNVMARSVLLATLEGHDYLLIALGDGHMQCYKYGADVQGSAVATDGVMAPSPDGGETPPPVLHDRRRLSVGTQPAALSLFRSRGSNHVFAACDRPTVVYAERGGGKLLVSNVNLEQVTRVCGFDTEHFPDCLSIATDEMLHLGAVDEIQKLHIQTIPLHEQARRIAHLETPRTFVVLTERTRIDESGEEVLESYVRLLSDSTYEKLDEHKLQPYEIGASVMSASFKGEGMEEKGEYLVVGTGDCPPNEPDAVAGRLLFFTVELDASGESRKLRLAGEQKVAGVVLSMVSFDGRLLAGINSDMVVFSVSLDNGDELKVKTDASYHGHVLVIKLQARNDFILAGDMMRSVCLLSKSKMGEDGLEQLARDYDAGWTMAAEIMEDDTFIMAEMSKNLITLRRNAHAATDTERARLERSGLFHLGALVNRIQHGSLVMQVADDLESPALKTMIFATADGMLGVIATLKKEDFDFFLEVQKAMASQLPGIGGFEHSEWRQFSTETPKRVQAATGFIDGDLVEAFLELPQAQAAKIANSVGRSVEELTRRCEAMQRLH